MTKNKKEEIKKVVLKGLEDRAGLVSDIRLTPGNWGVSVYLVLNNGSTVHDCFISTRELLTMFKYTPEHNKVVIEEHSHEKTDFPIPKGVHEI